MMRSSRATRWLLCGLLAVGAAAGRPALAAWPHDPTGEGLLLGLGGSPFTPASCPDGNGGAIVAWDESSLIRAQRVDAGGSVAWGPAAVTVATGTGIRNGAAVCPDGAGGAIIAWADQRSGVWDVYAQRVDANGTPLWTPNGVLVCGASLEQTGVQVASLGDLGAVVAWLDTRSGSSRCYAQLVSPSGAAQWPANGVELGTSAAGVQSELKIAAGSDGVSAAVWTDTRGGASDIYAQQVSAAGVIALAGGRSICSSAGSQTGPAIARSSGPGFLMAWSDSRSGTTDLYAQRTGGVFTTLWASNGVPVCQASGSQGGAVLVPHSGGAYVVWQDGRQLLADDIYAQSLAHSGTAQWTADGIAVCNQAGLQTSPAACLDGTGGLLVAWTDARGLDLANLDLYAQRLSSLGLPAWTTGGVAVNTSPRGSGSLLLCDDARGGGIATWLQAVPAVASQVLATRVDEFGVLGAEPVIADVADVPNDQGGLVKVSWDASPLDIDPMFRNVSQYWLYRSAPASLVSAARRAGVSVATPAGAASGDAPPRLLQTRFAARDYYWEFVTSTNAIHLARYSDVVPTTGDSTSAGNPRTAFMVLARNASGSQWWTSAPDSGYSVDDLAPAPPAAFAGQYHAGVARLHWNPNTEPDVAGYQLYRGATPAFVPGPANLVATQPDTGYVDAPGAPHYYKLAAVDVHGNASPAVTLLPSGTLDAGSAPPATAFLASPSPNPARAGCTLRLGLAISGGTRVALYDSQGRCVRVLFEGKLPSGEHALAFDGRDGQGRALAPGLYFASLRAPGFDATRRLVVVE